MSRIGKLPISISDKVKVTVDQNKVRVEGPKGILEQFIPNGIGVLIKDNEIQVICPDESGFDRNPQKVESLRGTIRAIINNMVIGVTQGHKKALLIEGQGYRAKLDDKKLSLQLGYADLIQYEPPEGIKVEVPIPHRIVIEGIDKQLVSDVAATIRAFKLPEHYKGKGIRYEREYIRRKKGKKAIDEGTRAAA